MRPPPVCLRRGPRHTGIRRFGCMLAITLLGASYPRAGPAVCRLPDKCRHGAGGNRRHGGFAARACGDKKIQVIKEVRALTNLGLKEAKDLVDSAPKPVLERVPKEQADQGKEKLEAAGATVEVK